MCKKIGCGVDVYQRSLEFYLKKDNHKKQVLNIAQLSRARMMQMRAELMDEDYEAPKLPGYSEEEIYQLLENRHAAELEVLEGIKIAMAQLKRSEKIAHPVKE